MNHDEETIITRLKKVFPREYPNDPNAVGIPIDILREWVSIGGFVCHLPSGVRRPLLHEFAIQGLVDCVAACLQTPHPIDWTTIDLDKRTVLHLLCLYEVPAEKAAAMLRLIVQRIETHPTDVVDWARETECEGDFLSSAASHQRLSLFFPIVRDQPYFADQTSPIVLQGNVWEWDWNALKEEDRNLLDGEEGNMKCVTRETGDLIALCEVSKWRPDGVHMKRLQEVIECGGDVFYSDMENVNGPVLHHFVREGYVDCAVLALRRSGICMDFTLGDMWGNTLLHCVCKDMMPDRAIQLLRTMLERMNSEEATRGNVKVNWLQEVEYHGHFFSCAAEAQILSQVWPVVKNRVLYDLGVREALRSNTDVSLPPPLPITLNGPLWQWDWELLPEEEKRFFTIEKASIRRWDRPTAMLIKMSRMKEADPAEVERCIGGGAKTGVADSSLDPVINRFLYHSTNPDVIRALLATKDAMDFTAVGSDGWTALHFLCYGEQSGEIAASMLRLIVERVNTHPKDSIQWDHRDNRGHEFLTVAALNGKLSDMWPEVKNLPFFVDRVKNGPIPLRRALKVWDREKLAADADFFIDGEC